MPRRITTGAWPTKKGEHDKAIADYTEAIRLDPKDAEAYCNRGLAYGNKGDYDKAIADYTEAIRLNPKYAEAYYNRGMTYASKGEYDKAIADYTEAIRLDPKYAEAYYSRGVGLREQGRLRQGDCRLHRGHPAGPEDCRWRIATGAGAYGKRASTTRRLPTTRGHPARPEGCRGVLQPGHRLSAERANTTRRLPTTPRPSGSNPKDAEAYYNRGWPTADKGEHDKAIADYTEAIRLDPKYAMAYCNRGIAYGKGRARQGDRRLHRGHPAGPEICRGVLQPGRAYGKKGEHDKAIADFTEAIRLDPKYAEAY